MSDAAVIVAAPARPASIGRRAKNTFIYALASIGVAIARRLPFGALTTIGRGVGALAWRFASAARETAIENVRSTIARDDPARARAIARSSFLRLGTLLGDTLALFDRSEPATARLPIDARSRAVLADAIATRRGVVLVTAHFGPWERLASALVECGATLVTPVRRSYDARLEAKIVEPLRAGRGVKTLDRDAASTPLQLARALKRGHVVGVLVDLNTRAPSIEADFLGRSARTVVAPARLAIARGAAVVCAMATRDGIVVELLRSATIASAHVDASEVRALVAQINERISDRIAREPESWIWMHPRWGARPVGYERAHDERALTAPRPTCEVARPPKGDGA